MRNPKTKILLFVACAPVLFCHLAFAQNADLEFTLDVNSSTVSLPEIFKPNIDLSGRGVSQDRAWPQALAASQALDSWKKDIGFSGVYRVQYDFWEINQLIKEKGLRQQMLDNYEKLIKDISDSGGTVILNIFGTPAGLGKVLDKKSPPKDLKTYKKLVKSHIRSLSCNKKYNIWYEVWNAPDVEDFFLGRRQEYLNLYRLVAESIKELEAETKMHIPLGGPSVSWWFQNLDGNTVVTPEKSLIYELIKFCYARQLPLDFISWHGYSTSPEVERVSTIYKKTPVKLIRDWLTYFKFNRDTPLILSEWNFDNGINYSSERQENSYICSSYILSRLKNMHEAGIDYQLYFCLEDFDNKKEGLIRNVGVFWAYPQAIEYKGGPKTSYGVFRFLRALGKDMLSPVMKNNDEFTGIIATKNKNDEIILLIYNYIDQDIGRNYISNNIASLNDAERKSLLNIIKAGKIEKIIRKQIEFSDLRLTNKVEAMLKKAQDLNDKAMKQSVTERNIKINIKNIPEGYYLYKRYTIDSSCGLSCEFVPAEEKKIPAAGLGEQILFLKPYSVNMIVLTGGQKEPEAPPAAVAEEPAASIMTQEVTPEKTAPEAAKEKQDDGGSSTSN